MYTFGQSHGALNQVNMINTVDLLQFKMKKAVWTQLGNINSFTPGYP
jgi:hypothetical protein